MKKYFNYFFSFFFMSCFLASCVNYKKLITDEIVLKDGNSQTGTIILCDSTAIKLKKIDESINSIQWKYIDSIRGKKLKTLWVGINLGYYKIPYFSVFRNEAITSKYFGSEYKVGMAYRGDKLYYINLSHSSAKPYAITKFGFGYQYYFKQTTYLKKNSYFIGTELNFMGVQYNNGFQTTFEPFGGYERKLNEHFRIHAKLGLQFNLANKNNKSGINFTIGIHYMKRNFKTHYDTLNNKHQLTKH